MMAAVTSHVSAVRRTFSIVVCVSLPGRLPNLVDDWIRRSNTSRQAHQFRRS